MADTEKPLLIKRYASRRLYNTETSDYVTLEDIAGFIRAGREVQIVDLKSGDDLTRQYLLQIVAEHESKGENVLPINVLTDLVRSYTTEVQSVVPQFLAMSFEMLRDGQSKMMENLSTLPNPMAAVPGFDDLMQAAAGLHEDHDGGHARHARRAGLGRVGPGATTRTAEGRRAPTNWRRSRSNWPNCRRSCRSSDAAPMQGMRRWPKRRAASRFGGSRSSWPQPKKARSRLRRAGWGPALRRSASSFRGLRRRLARCCWTAARARCG